MKSLSCILLFVERGAGPYLGLSKALLLARHFGARLELLLCETQHPVAPLTGNTSVAERARAECIGEGERYLRALRHTIVSPDIEIGTEVVCAPSPVLGLADKLRRAQVQIVVKAARVAAGLLGPLEWQLATRCSAPLLLTAGRAWRATPRFAAALDLSEHAHARPGDQIVGLSEMLARRCGAELDYLYAAPTRGAGARTASEAHRRLHALLPAQQAGLGRLQYCSGEAAGVLPRLIARRDYDLLAVGTASNPSGAACGALTRALLQASAGDVLLVPAGVSAAGTLRRETEAMAG
ncbi:MAG TPA: hypothetical protein VMD56_10160 [Steroidobacteraceae bacterium]|nr:hypothetical protein [Steroidobacteraceae bacterium]